MSHLLDEITIPIKLFLALVDGDACPMCLGRLRQQDVCPECGADLSPVLDLYENGRIGGDCQRDN